MKGVIDHYRRRVRGLFHRNRFFVHYKLLVFKVFPSRRRKKVLQAASTLVTPYSGFMLSEYYLSREIDEFGLVWLNPKSKRLKRSFPSSTLIGGIIYCQVDQLEEFVKLFLPKIIKPYVLITGKCNLPPLEDSDYVQEILSHPKLLGWFSQNQIFEHLEIMPFPYGVDLENSPCVMEHVNNRTGKKSDSVLTPFARIHDHLKGRIRADREFLISFMEPKKPLNDYLKDLDDNKWIVSPAGDRPDTFRHWESLALGSIPISVLPKNFENLFEDSLLIVENFDFLEEGLVPVNDCVHNDELVLLSFWKRKVEVCMSNAS